ncbi:MAG: 3'-5' exonuclease [Jhaorihella sp.]
MKNYRNAKHVMLDIETLDTAPSTVVLSVAAIAFSMDAEQLLVQDQLELHLSTRPQLFQGRTTSKDTIAWWKRQDAAARQLVSAPLKDEFDPASALLKLSVFIDFNKPDYVWAQGASFDFPILMDMARSYNMTDLGWKFWQERDSRTVISGAGIDKSEIFKEGPYIAHNPIDDCMVHAEALRRAVFDINVYTGEGAE